MLLHLSEQLKHALSHKWSAVIRVQGQGHFTCSDEVNLVDFLTIIAAIDPTFPKNASLRILPGVNASADDVMLKYIKERALAGGTDLKVSGSGPVKAKNSDRNLFIRFECAKGRLSAHEVKHFPEGKLQQSLTKKAVEHKCRVHGETTSSCRKNKDNTCRPTDVNHLCPFHFVIFQGDDNMWYLSSMRRGANVGSDLSYHLHHPPVISTHMTCPKRDLNENVISDIKACFDSRMPCPNIKLFIQSKYKISVTDAMLRSLEKKYINSWLETLEENATVDSDSPVQRLLKFLECMKTVTYSYVTHRMNSGFVTFHRKKNEISSKSISGDDIGIDDDCIQDWRQQLRVKANEILVSLSFIHEEQLRYFKMFPEFLAIDTTFGTNVQRRPLLMITAVDGCNKTLPVFQSWMPSKMSRAFRWTIAGSLPQLIDVSILKRVQVICSDQEFAMVQPLRAHMTSYGVFPYARHRYDRFHMFDQKWKEVPKADDNPVLVTMRKWIITFFNKVETKTEFCDSLQQLRKWISLNDKKLSESQKEMSTSILVYPV